MKKNDRSPRLFSKKDFLWISILLLVAMMGFLLLSGQSGHVAKVRINGTIVQTIPLSQTNRYTFKNNGISLTVAVDNGTARVTTATCPDRVCVQTGTLAKAGQTAVCLPAEFSLTIEGEAPTYDGVTY